MKKGNQFFNNLLAKKENLIVALVLIGFFSLLLFNRGYISGLIVDESQFGTVVSTNEFSVTPNSQQIMKGSSGSAAVSVKGDYVLPYVMVYTRNEGWKKINLAGKFSEEDSNYLSGEGTTNVQVSQENNFHGKNIIVAYSCNKKNGELDCHGDNYISTSFNLEFVFPQQASSNTQQQNSQPQETLGSCQAKCIKDSYGLDSSSCQNAQTTCAQGCGFMQFICSIGCVYTKKNSCDTCYNTCGQKFSQPSSGQAQPSSPAQAQQPAVTFTPSGSGGGVVVSGGQPTTTTQTQQQASNVLQCPNTCPLEGQGFTTTNPQVCPMGVKYDAATGKTYRGKSPGVCESVAQIDVRQPGGTVKRYCRCEPINYNYLGSNWIGKII